jgi:hypothetical protein
MILALILTAGATVTLPLDEDQQHAHAAEPPPPPIAAVVSAQRLSARATPGGLAVDGRWTVDVLGSAWSRVCVLKLDSGTELIDLPHLDEVTLAPVGGELCLISRKPGSYSFEVKLKVQGNRVVAGKDALWSTVDFDGDAVPQQQGGWTLIAKKKPVVIERPPLEPSISLASAQLISTVEGRAQLTMAYQLKLDREQPISFTVPDGWRVDRVSVNGVARKTGLSLTVTPERDTDGAVELQLSKELGVFHLSGRLDFELPKPSWPVAQLDAEVYLPAVFEYRRVGGSLEPAQNGTQLSKFPGRMLSFRQHLIAASAPTVELEYSVDLKGRYFKMGGD